MTDVVTQRPMRVSTDSWGGPYLDLPFSQVEEVRKLLDSRHIFYWVDEHVISFNGGPATTVINFGHEGDAAAIQAALDSVR
jgi:hypothetical protein